jgi:hypothetical protein
LPLRLEGQASGSLEGTMPAVTPGEERTFTSKLELEAPRLKIMPQNITTEKLHGTVDYRKKNIDYSFEWEALGGKWHIDGQIPPPKTKPAPNEEGHLRIQGVQLGQLWTGPRAASALRSLQGVVDVDLRFRHEGADLWPVGNGVLQLRGLRWDNISLADSSLRGDLVLTEQDLRLRNLSGTMGQGALRGQVSLNPRDWERSWINLTLDRAEAARLLAPWPRLAANIQGPLQLRLRGRLGTEWTGTGDLVLARGRVAGIEVSEWRLPFDWIVAPRYGRVQFEIRDSTTQLAGGRLVTQASLGWGEGSRMEGRLRFYSLDLRLLMRQATDFSQVASGQVSGRFDFWGNDVRSLDDLRGTLDATLQQTQALQLPVLQQVAPFLLSSQSSTLFQNGNLRGRLAGGIFRIERLTFTGNLLQLLVEGTVTTQGRLNLEVTAQTGQLGANPRLLRLLGLRIPTVGPIPVSLLITATDYLSNRLVHLRVTGTLHSPVITIEPISLLTQEAVLFFLNRSNVPLP